MSRFTYDQIEEITIAKEHEDKHFMPNEIFDDLIGSLKSSPHIAFSYSYYYLVSWLYRHTKYGEGETNINVQVIKKLLGYSPTTKTVNYIIKNKGVMDLLGYTETVADYPLHVELDENNEPDFTTMLSDLDSNMRQMITKDMGVSFKVKYPVKHMHRDEVEYKDGMLTGVYYDISNTHMVNFETFVHCMSIKELGSIGFYIYGYLKMKNQLFESGYDASLINLSKETGVPHKSLTRYLDGLKKYGLITAIHNQEYFSQGILDGERKANTYIANDPMFFTHTPQPYKKMEVKTYDEHLLILTKKKDAAMEKKMKSRVEIALGELPY